MGLPIMYGVTGGNIYTNMNDLLLPGFPAYPKDETVTGVEATSTMLPAQVEQFPIFYGFTRTFGEFAKVSP